MKPGRTHQRTETTIRGVLLGTVHIDFSASSEKCISLRVLCVFRVILVILGRI